LLVAVGVAALAGAAFLVGCSSSSAPEMSTAAAVVGPIDMHCTMNGTAIKQSIGMCMTGSAASALSADDGGDALSATDARSTDGESPDAGSIDTGSPDAAATDTEATDAGVDAGSADDGGDSGGGDYGPTLYNFEGDDDDCKYHVKWSSTAVKENVGVTFAVTATRLIDGAAATGANVELEVFLDTSHPTPTTDIPNTESSGGNYKVGPVVFDAPGKWTVRFHFYEMCSDEPEDSPHGHAAFFVNVP
jgi:hypothetical protein